MSIVSGVNDLRVYMNDGSPSGEFPGYTLQAEQVVSITKVASGFPVVLTTTPRLACGIESLTWNGQQYLYAPDHGMGLQFAFALRTILTDSSNYTPNNDVFYAPTETGSQADGTSQSVCSSNNLLRGKNAAGDGMVRVTKPAQWGTPGKLTAPIPISTRVVSEFPTTIYTDIGYLGNNHIVRFRNTFSVPNLPELIPHEYGLWCPVTSYSPIANFSVCKQVNCGTGVATVVPTPGSNAVFSTTEPYMWATPAGDHACAVYGRAVDLGPNGFYCTRSGANHGNCFFFWGPARWVGGLPPGDLQLDGYYCFGPEATVIAALMQLRAALG